MRRRMSQKTRQNDMTVRELIKKGQEKLEAAGKDGAAFDARALLSFVMDIPFRDMAVHYSDEPSDKQASEFLDLIGRRLSGEPLQYITGEQEFMGLDFHVDERVLIPRLDTEILAEEAVRYVQRKLAENHQESSAGVNGSCSPFTVLDLCCGSGAIGLSVAKLAVSGSGQDENEVRVVLSDISGDALDVARENAESLGVADMTDFIQSDLFEDLPDDLSDGICDMQFGLITANPPYIRSEVIDTLDCEVKDCEPRLALDGGSDGLDVYRRIISEAPDHLEAGGRLMMEIGYDQAEDIRRLLEEDGRYSGITIRKDLAGLDRAVICTV